MRRIITALCATFVYFFANGIRANDPSFRVAVDVPLRQASQEFCWFHPRVAAIPRAGRNGQPAVVMTIQKHLSVDDHYSGLWFLRTNDLGATWTKPTEIPELSWIHEDPDITVSVADVTPGWHAQSQKLLVIGTKVRYGPSGKQLLERPLSHDVAYATLDPHTNQWSKWKFLESPNLDSKQFHLLAPGCVQWLVKADGSILLPVYFKAAEGQDFSTTVLSCNFDGEILTCTGHGDILKRDGGRGYVEPSLAIWDGRYFMTLRNDQNGYVATSKDGMTWGEPVVWKFDDGSQLGSYNTQQHWLTHSDGLYLAYTRSGANNDHIARNRAPLFLAEVDHERLTVRKQTEQILVPERGVMLGNFGAASITNHESWITDAEYLLSDKPQPRGADGSTFVARVGWTKPNKLIETRRPLRIITLGDSITRGVRPGVTEDQTFASLLQTALTEEGHAVDVVNVGIGGETTKGALDRVASAVIALRPDVVTIMYGTNDSYVYPEKTQTALSTAQFEQNLHKIVEQLRAASITPVLMTEPRWGVKAKPNGIGEHPNISLTTFMARSRAVAEEKRIPVVDHFAAWSTAQESGFDVGTWTTDQCHLNPEGHGVVAALLLKVLREEKLIPPPK